MIDTLLALLEQTAGGGSVRAISHRILAGCRQATGAEAGTIFLVRRAGRRRVLEAMSVQNDRIRMKDRSFTVPYDSRSIAGHVAVTGRTALIDDAYALPPDSEYRFNPGVDVATGYRTRSILCFPLGNFRGEHIGVVQLVNRLDPVTGEVAPFEPAHEALIAPVNAVLGRVLEQAEAMDRIAEANAKLRAGNRRLREEQAQVEALRAETEAAFQVSVRLLARAAELHDENTGQHIQRVSEYSYALARRAGLPDAFCEEIRYSAQLHDVGKMSVDQAILKKPGRLTAEEFAEMQRHAEYGYEILRVSDRLQMAAEIALSHHERWRGGGYPRGLAGTDIPVSARLVAIADVYDALRSTRPYKAGIDHARTVEIMLTGDDRLDPAAHFDPGLLALFERHHGDFADVWEALKQ
ncbi:MAG TPA: HD domain-containing phosphohydrolase [Azospirillaceae bacterium]|nr:HD domain-containing phosphohydrolase [Azospirillaceae bacterium]